MTYSYNPSYYKVEGSQGKDYKFETSLGYTKLQVNLDYIEFKDSPHRLHKLFQASLSNMVRSCLQLKFGDNIPICDASSRRSNALFWLS